MLSREMDRLNHNSDKITIKVRHSNENYHEITIDWSNASFDYRKQLFRQLSEYTGIPLWDQESVAVINVATHRRTELLNTHSKKVLMRGHWNWQWNTKEEAMNALHDGDCYLLRTKLSGFSCEYELCHQDLVQKTECNEYYCHHLGRRFYTRKFAKFLKSEELKTYLRGNVHEQTEEEMRLALNFQQFTRLKCTAQLSAWFGSGQYPHNFMYLRYRG